MIIALAAHVATTAAITGGHVVIAAHFASAARLTRRLFAIFAACTRRHGHLKIGTGLGCCAHHWPCRDGFVVGGGRLCCVLRSSPLAKDAGTTLALPSSHSCHRPLGSRICCLGYVRRVMSVNAECKYMCVMIDPRNNKRTRTDRSAAGVWESKQRSNELLSRCDQPT